ncbi:MAG TPA: aminopeptidase [Bacilli bacterium]|nr:aminopeptidase [Bacilli bacterium]
MGDPRYAQLAKTVVEYSLDLQPGEKVLFSVNDDQTEITTELIKAAYAVGALPFVQQNSSKVRRELFKNVTQEQVELMAQSDLAFMKQMDAWADLGNPQNLYEFRGISAEKMKMFAEKYVVPVHYEERVNNTKWVLVPTPMESMAQKAEMATEDWADFLFNVTTMDYGKMEEAAKPLKELMDRTDNVRIIGNGTDLTFSIKGVGSVMCVGKRNLPDGEVFSAPVRDSINGVLQYNAPTVYQNTSFDNVRFVFRDGKIVEATANNNEKLNEILDTDEGARYIGEFAIAFNPYVLEPMRNILFDEKIAGSFHFTPGQCYDQTPNGNKSSVHWDIVNIQRPEYGGGEIWFDDVLIRKDGLFVLPELQGLNPENLK